MNAERCICGSAIAFAAGAGKWVHVEEIAEGYDDQEHDATPALPDAPAQEREPTPSERQASALESIAKSLAQLVTLVKRRPPT